MHGGEANYSETSPPRHGAARRTFGIVRLRSGRRTVCIEANVVAAGSQSRSVGGQCERGNGLVGSAGEAPAFGYDAPLRVQSDFDPPEQRAAQPTQYAYPAYS